MYNAEVVIPRKIAATTSHTRGPVQSHSIARGTLQEMIPRGGSHPIDGPDGGGFGWNSKGGVDQGVGEGYPLR